MVVLSVLDVFEEPFELREYTLTEVLEREAMIVAAVEIMSMELGLEPKHKTALIEAYREIIPKVNRSMLEIELRK